MLKGFVWTAESCAPIKILGRALSLIRQGKWLFVSPSNFVILVGQFQNSRDVCLFLTTVIVRDVGDAVA
jgi:hypothetical protein